MAKKRKPLTQIDINQIQNVNNDCEGWAWEVHMMSRNKALTNGASRKLLDDDYIREEIRKMCELIRGGGDRDKWEYNVKYLTDRLAEQGLELVSVPSDMTDGSEFDFYHENGIELVEIPKESAVF